MNPGERSQLIDDLLEGVISEADFLRLEAELTIDPAAREDYYHRVALSAALQTEAGAAAESGHKIVAMPAPRRLRMIAFAAMAAVLAVSLAVIGMLLNRRDPKMSRGIRSSKRRPDSPCWLVRPTRFGRTRRRLPTARCCRQDRCNWSRAWRRLNCSAA